MSKAKMYGMNKTFIPNSKADQMKKRFKRKAQKRKECKKAWDSLSNAGIVPAQTPKG